jgi:2-iminobutanoate/2-iminopropanoate deaminase
MNKLKAPKPVGPYSMFRYLSTLAPIGNWVMAGSIPIDPSSGQLNNDTVEDEVNQVFDNIEAVLADNNKTLEDVKKFTVFLMDLSYTPLVNAQIEKRIKGEYPARSTIQVSALPMGARVEIECLG